MIGICVPSSLIGMLKTKSSSSLISRLGILDPKFDQQAENKELIKFDQQAEICVPSTC